MENVNSEDTEQTSEPAAKVKQLKQNVTCGLNIMLFDRTS